MDAHACGKFEEVAGHWSVGYLSYTMIRVLLQLLENHLINCEWQHHSKDPNTQIVRRVLFQKFLRSKIEIFYKIFVIESIVGVATHVYHNVAILFVSIDMMVHYQRICFECDRMLFASFFIY